MDMKVIFKRIVISALAILMLLPCVAFPGSAAGQEQAYSYVYDSYGNANESPSPYQTDSRIDVTAFGLTPLKAASSLFVREDELYICDTGNHRIIQLSLANDTVELVRLIDSAADGSALFGPTDVFVTADGRMVVSDAGNNRILIMDSELNVLSEIRRPTDVSVDQTFTKESGGCRLTVTLGGKNMIQEESYYTIGDDGKLVEHKAVNWRDQASNTQGGIPISNEFKGWVGIPLENYAAKGATSLGTFKFSLRRYTSAHSLHANDELIIGNFWIGEKVGDTWAIPYIAEADYR